MSLNINILYASAAFAAGGLFTVSAYTSLSQPVANLYFTFLASDTIDGMFWAMDAAFDTLTMIGTVFLITFVYFASRYVSQETHRGRRMTAIVFATLVGTYSVFVVAANLL